MKKILPLIVFLFLLTACSGDEFAIQDAWARPALAGNNSAVYFVINNGLPESDVLLSVQTSAAGAAEMHMSMAIDPDSSAEQPMEGMEMDGGDMPGGQVMTMVQQDEVQVPGMSEVYFEPGGLHVMLIGLKRDLNPGDTLSLTLTFQVAGEITVDVPITEP